MKKYVCLRDDDTCFFTQPEELRDGYGKFFGKIPVTLATIPFAHGSHLKIGDYTETPEMYDMVRAWAETGNTSALYKYAEGKRAKLRLWEKEASAEELSDYHKIHPVGDNKALLHVLSPLIQKGKIEIAQHGVFHRYNEFGAEMYAGQMSLASIRDGKEYLEKVFAVSVKTFIAPSNTIDKTCCRYVDELGMHLFCGHITYRNYWDKLVDYVIKEPSVALERLRFKFSKIIPPIYRANHLFCFGAVTYDIFKTHQYVLDNVYAQLNTFGFVAICTHYPLLSNSEYHERYHDLLQRLSNDSEIEFVTASDYYDLLVRKYYA